MSSSRYVVIGAGILGASVAARLASAGLRVTLLDQDQPGRAASRWSFAWLNSNDKAPRPYHDLNHAGMKAWAELAPDLDGDAWYRPVGHVELATTDAGRAELEARVRRLTEWGYPARLIDAAEAERIEPSLRLPPGAAALAWFPEEGYLLTEPLIARLVAYAKSHGADVLVGEPGRVTGLETGPGAAPRVRTAAGAVLAAEEVVCCAGRWTPALAAVPLVPWETPGSTAPALVVRVGPVAPPGPVRLVHTPEISLRPHFGGLGVGVGQFDVADGAVPGLAVEAGRELGPGADAGVVEVVVGPGRLVVRVQPGETPLACGAARLVLVQQRHAQASRGQPSRHRGAEDARADHHVAARSGGHDTHRRTRPRGRKDT